MPSEHSDKKLSNNNLARELVENEFCKLITIKETVFLRLMAKYPITVHPVVNVTALHKTDQKKKTNRPRFSLKL